MANFSEMFDDFVNKGMKDLNQTIKTVVSKVDGIKSESVAVNIIETGVSYRIEVVAPGFAKENFKLGIDNGVISIKGERETTTQTANEQFLRQEFVAASFERSFNLPKTIDVAKVEASYRDGILYVTIGKKDEFIQQSGININIQ
jgi:HSP20 family protein